MITYRYVNSGEMKCLYSLDINGDLDDSLYEDSCFPYFNEEMIPFRSYILALEGDRILGVCCYNVHNEEKRIGLGYITVHRNFRHQGIGKQLLTMLFNLMKQKKYRTYTLNIGSFTTEGKKYLQPVYLRLKRDTTLRTTIIIGE